MSEETQQEERHEEAPKVETSQPAHIPVVAQLSVALSILLVIFGVTYVNDVRNLIQLSEENEPIAENVLALESTGTEAKEKIPHDAVTVVARSAFVWDVVGQRALYNKNADERWPLASVTKLMTALVAYEILEENETVNISIDAIKEDGDSGLTDGEVFSFQDLTDLTLIGSSNDGAHALAAAAGLALSSTRNSADVFVDAMNLRAGEIGLTQTYFNNATGLDLSESKAGAYGSARDMAFLMEYIITHYPDLLALTTEEKTLIPNGRGEEHYVENTNEVVRNIQGLIASKTGYTDLAGGNLVVAFDAGLNRPIVIAVLGSTSEDRFGDVLALSEMARAQVLENNK